MQRDNSDLTNRTVSANNLVFNQDIKSTHTIHTAHLPHKHDRKNKK